MTHFWDCGYASSSMDDLVAATGVSRHGIYADYTGKYDLFTASLVLYKEAVVTPAFAGVEAPGALLGDVSKYFEHQIHCAEVKGFPSSGCLMANTMTEVAPHDEPIRKLVNDHMMRLRHGFESVIRNELKARGQKAKRGYVVGTANLMAIFAQGLWSTSRGIEDARSLRSSATLFISIIRASVSQ